MGPDLSRRSLLRAGGLTAAAAALGWRPSLGAPIGPMPEGPPPSGSWMTLGVIMQVSSDIVDVEGVRDYVEESLRRELARFAGRKGLVNPMDERWAEYGPGDALVDPPWGDHTAIRLKQEWQVA
jgi:hypothetical protein